ncbi:MAG: AAA family ATPase [Halobacteriota archaeon]
MDVDEAHAAVDEVLDAMSEAVIADRSFLETVAMGLLARGHVLLEDVPGTGKTLTARLLATALGLEFSRIQFTPDLLPTDVTGTHVYNEGTGSFEFAEGPIFANIVLADEINRAPPKSQAALLEAMEEGQVTADGETFPLPRPFFVIATQNPVEHEGTFDLPEAQLDRFMVKTSIGYPDLEGETLLLRRRAARTAQSPEVGRVLDPGAVDDLRRAPESVHVDDDVIDYIAALCQATRDQPAVRIGVSPRGTQRLFEASRARAVIAGRDYVTPDDVKWAAKPVLGHRLILTPDAKVDNVHPHDLLERIFEQIPVPTLRH